MSAILHGENGITYALFTSLDDIAKMNYFIDCVTYFPSNVKPPLVDNPNLPLSKNSTEHPQIHLFPSFGRKNGIGEPDVMILHGTNLFIVEVETASHANGGLPQNFYDQFQRFIDLGITIERDKASGRKKMGKNTVAVENTEKYFKGEFRTRKFYKTLMSRGIHQYYYILLSDDHKKDIYNIQFNKNSIIDKNEKKIREIYNQLYSIDNHHFGWIGMNSVKRFNCFDANTKRIIQETIDYNLK